MCKVFGFGKTQFSILPTVQFPSFPLLLAAHLPRVRSFCSGVRLGVLGKKFLLAEEKLILH